MTIFDHVTIRVADRSALGLDSYHTPTFSTWGNFQLTRGDDLNPVTRRVHVGFAAPSREQVGDFWRAGVDAGYRNSGSPGPRPEYREDYYGAFLLDPDGNGIEAVHHGGARRNGAIDHLWIRVTGLAAARRFYEAITYSAAQRARVALRDELASTHPGGSPEA